MRSMHKLLMQCATATVAVILAVPGMPQEPAPQGGTIKTQVNLVNLFATVRDKNKRIMADLKQDDFKIQEDNQDQKIAFFSKEVALPITLALLLDTSGSEQFMLSAIQEAGSSFLHRVLRKGDEHWSCPSILTSICSPISLTTGRNWIARFAGRGSTFQVAAPLQEIPGPLAARSS